MEKKCNYLSPTLKFFYDSYNSEANAYYFCPDDSDPPKYSYPTLMWTCDFPPSSSCNPDNTVFVLLISNYEVIHTIKSNFNSINGIYSYSTEQIQGFYPNDYIVELVSICDPDATNIISSPVKTKIVNYPPYVNDMEIDGQPKLIGQTKGDNYISGQIVEITWGINKLEESDDYYIAIGTYFLIFSSRGGDIKNTLSIDFTSSENLEFSTKYSLPREMGIWEIYIAVMDGCSNEINSVLIKQLNIIDI